MRAAPQVPELQRPGAGLGPEVELAFELGVGFGLAAAAPPSWVARRPPVRRQSAPSSAPADRWPSAVSAPRARHWRRTGATRTALHRRPHSARHAANPEFPRT